MRHLARGEVRATRDPAHARYCALYALWTLPPAARRLSSAAGAAQWRGPEDMWAPPGGASIAAAAVAPGALLLSCGAAAGAPGALIALSVASADEPQDGRSAWAGGQPGGDDDSEAGVGGDRRADGRSGGGRHKRRRRGWRITRAAHRELSGAAEGGLSCLAAAPTPPGTRVALGLPIMQGLASGHCRIPCSAQPAAGARCAPALPIAPLIEEEVVWEPGSTRSAPQHPQSA